jgi:hypothetical protein
MPAGPPQAFRNIVEFIAVAKSVSRLACLPSGAPIRGNEITFVSISLMFNLPFVDAARAAWNGPGRGLIAVGRRNLGDLGKIFVAQFVLPHDEF